MGDSMDDRIDRKKRRKEYEIDFDNDEGYERLVD